ncbi:MAG: hypothetical protein C4313_05670 [Thermoflexus sp.]|uniref:hypothetical protein n=1 Tax=Thermoflexus sp. TaxID=1969742 RepID=UPI0033197818
MALAQRAAEIVIAWAQEHPADRREAFVAALEDLLRALREAHPDMAPPWHLTAAAREAVAGATDGPAARAAVIAAMQAFRQRLRDHEEAAAGHAAALLRSIRVLFTHSRSRLVAQALARAAADGHRLQVLCPIAEPGGEGRRMAEEAAAQGHTALLLPDLVAAHYLPHADLVLVGADAWDPEGIIKRWGRSPSRSWPGTSSAPSSSSPPPRNAGRPLLDPTRPGARPPLHRGRSRGSSSSPGIGSPG